MDVADSIEHSDEQEIILKLRLCMAISAVMTAGSLFSQVIDQYSGRSLMIIIAGAFINTAALGIEVWMFLYFQSLLRKFLSKTLSAKEALFLDCVIRLIPFKAKTLRYLGSELFMGAFSEPARRKIMIVLACLLIVIGGLFITEGALYHLRLNSWHAPSSHLQGIIFRLKILNSIFVLFGILAEALGAAILVHSLRKDQEKKNV